MDNTTGNFSCFEQIGQLNEGLRPYETLRKLNPGDSKIWKETGEVWLNTFTVAGVILGVVYFALGLTSTILLVKKGSPRLPIRTFFAVYLNIAILGISRALLLWLDPFSVLGFIGDRFPSWIIISRYLAVLGFPSLVASCTVIIFTLIKIVAVKPGKKWYEYWRYVILITAIPYTIALLAESLGHISTFTAIFSGLLCEVFFVLWGAIVCITYLSAGFRLLKELAKNHRKTLKMSESETADDRKVANRPHSKKTKMIFRKILKITIGTAIAGLVYSFVAAGSAILSFLLIFYQCMGSMERKGDPTAWITFQLANRVLEIILSLFILYSVTDTTTLFSFLKNLKESCARCSSRETALEKDANGTVIICSDYLQDSSQEVEDQEVNMAGIKKICYTNSDAENSTTEPQIYTIKIQEPSGSSIDSIGKSLEKHLKRKMTISRSFNALPKLDDSSSDHWSGGTLDTDLISQVFPVSNSPCVFCQSKNQNNEQRKCKGCGKATSTSSVPNLVNLLKETGDMKTSRKQLVMKQYYSHAAVCPTSFPLSLPLPKHTLHANTSQNSLKNTSPFPSPHDI